MSDAERIERLECALAVLCEMLARTNPHIERELLDMAEILSSAARSPHTPDREE